MKGTSLTLPLDVSGTQNLIGVKRYGGKRKTDPKEGSMHFVLAQGRSPGLMSREGVPYHVTYPTIHVMYLSPVNRQMPVKILPSRNFVCRW